jgi:hypothetical protein
LRDKGRKAIEQLQIEAESKREESEKNINSHQNEKKNRVSWII